MRNVHSFLGASHAANHRRTTIVIALTAAMMVAEIVAGWWSGSMALLADGWHMATHAGALSITALAYAYARRHERDPRFAFGTGKVGDLAGFASALVLAVVALWIGVESALRLVHPVAIAFDEAIVVAIVGLLVNVASAWVLGGGEHDHAAPAHRHGDACAEDHEAHAHLHRDHNLRSAYLHVLADAATSVAAILGLAAGKFLGLAWLDPAVGVLGAGMILLWALGLLRDTAAVLLDTVPGDGIVAAVHERLAIDGDAIVDLHCWRLGPGHVALMVEIETDSPRPAAHYRQQLAGVRHLSHVTIEVTRRAGPA